MTAKVVEIDVMYGPPPRHLDAVTERLSAYAKAFEDAQKVRQASHLRGDETAATLFKDVEGQLSRRLGKELKSHALWPFLSKRKGLAGPLSARVIALIGDPRRFPGQKCSIGHTLPPLYEVGAPCPITADGNREIDQQFGGEPFDQADKVSEIGSIRGLVDYSNPDGKDEIEYPAGVGALRAGDEISDEFEKRFVSCAGIMLPPRPGTGVRSLWHYAGLHVVDGHLPRRRKGIQADWNSTLRTLALQPNGLADQIVKHRTEPYRTVYDEARARDKYHSVARTIAAKAFLGDLLIHWKDLVGGALTTSPNVPLTPPTNSSVRRVGDTAATTNRTPQGAQS